MTPQCFDRHIRELKELSAQFFTLDDIERGQRPEADRPGFVITFDDGFRDNFTVATDVLNSHGVAGVFFVIGGLPERTQLLWEHRLFQALSNTEKRTVLCAELSERLSMHLSDAQFPTIAIHETPPAILDSVLEKLCGKDDDASAIRSLYPTWEEIRAAQRGGHQIGCHTMYHRCRHMQTDDEFRADLKEAKSTLESHLQREIRSFSYPYNAYRLGDEEICGDVGFYQVSTVDPGRFRKGIPLEWLPRRSIFRIHESMIRFRGLLAKEGF